MDHESARVVLGDGWLQGIKLIHVDGNVDQYLQTSYEDFV